MLGIPFKEHFGGIQYPSPSKSVITGWWLCNFKHHNATATEILPKAYSKVHQSIWMAEVSTDLWLKVWSPFASALEPPFLVAADMDHVPCCRLNPTCPDVSPNHPTFCKPPYSAMMTQNGWQPFVFAPHRNFYSDFCLANSLSPRPEYRGAGSFLYSPWAVDASIWNWDHGDMGWYGDMGYRAKHGKTLPCEHQTFKQLRLMIICLKKSNF